MHRPGPLLPWGSNYNLHNRQVGRLSDASLLPTSGNGQAAPGGLQFTAEYGIPYKRCGFKRTPHAHSRFYKPLCTQEIRRVYWTHYTAVSGKIQSQSSGKICLKTEQILLTKRQLLRLILLHPQPQPHPRLRKAPLQTTSKPPQARQDHPRSLDIRLRLPQEL